MFAQLDDTIVAISSPAGVGTRGIIRLSGPGAFAIAGAVFHPNGGESLTESPGHRRIFGGVTVGPRGRVPAEAYAFRAPASYTRQDVLELHTVGSPPVLSMVLERLTAAGARPAEAGEFTARAFFNGALDLTQVEGVAAIIHARNDSQLRASEALLHGRLARRSHALRERLADLLALVEAEIDFVEEPIEFLSRAALVDAVQAVIGELESLLREAPAVERLEVLPEVMLVGPPNAGKSTLLNALTGVDRAIASATAGTTRDVLRAPLSLPQGEVMLADTAGLEPAADRPEVAGNQIAGDRLASLAAATTQRRLAGADLLLAVLDASSAPAAALPLLQAGLPGRASLVVLSKLDLLTPAAKDTVLAEVQASARAPVVAVSALTGEGLDALRIEIGRRVFTDAGAHGAELLALSQRQRAALRDAQTALQRAEGWAARSGERELIAVEIREAVHALSLLSGEVATEELLGRIFARFCIGK